MLVHNTTSVNMFKIIKIRIIVLLHQCVPNFLLRRFIITILFAGVRKKPVVVDIFNGIIINNIRGIQHK